MAAQTSCLLPASLASQQPHSSIPRPRLCSLPHLVPAFHTTQPSTNLWHSSAPTRKRCLGVHAQSKGDPGPGDNESKAVLDAFFIGKAFAEAVTERIGSAVGEFLSDVGRWQAEQQKQARNFQDEVQERAKVAKLRAARKVSTSEESREKQLPSSNGSPTASTSVRPSATVQPRRSNPPFQESQEM